MAVEAGAISYDVEVDTHDLLRAQAETDKSIDKIVKSFDKAEKAVKDFEISQKALGRSISDLGIIYDKNGKVLATVTNRYQGLKDQVVNTSTAMNNATTKTSKAFKLQKNSMQQVGFQVQDMIVQIQGGTSAFVAMGQQGSQLAGILGPGGAVVGAAIAAASVIGGMLYNAMKDGSEITEELTEKVKGLSFEFDRLGSAQAVEAMKKIGVEINANTKLVTEARKEQEALDKRIAASTKLIAQYGEDSKVGENLTRGLIKTREEFEKQAEIIEIGEKNLADLGDKYEQLAGSLDRSEKGLQSHTDAATRDTEAIKSMIEALKIQANTIGRTEKETALYLATQLNATEAEKAAIVTYFASINAFKDKTAATKSANEALREQMALEQKQAKQQAKANEATISKGAGVVSGLLTPQEELLSQLNLRQSALDAARALDLENENVYLEAKRRANEEYVEGLKKIDAGAMTAQEKRLKELGVSWEAMGVQAAGALTGIATGAMTGQEAMRGLAMTILNQLVGALITMGVQAIIGQTTATAAGVASAATLATAYAPAAAMVSLATFGANAAPAAAGIASTVALSSGLALAGGRQFGGPVNANSAYRVGEAGPEIFQTQSGQNIMIPGENGKVLSNGDSMGAMGGGPMEVIVNNYGAPMDVSVNQNDRQITIDLTLKAVANQISNNQGAIPKALKNSSNYQSKANR